MDKQPDTTKLPAPSSSQAKTLPAASTHVATTQAETPAGDDELTQKMVEDYEERDYGALVQADRALQMGWDAS